MENVGGIIMVVVVAGLLLGTGYLTLGIFKNVITDMNITGGSDITAALDKVIAIYNVVPGLLTVVIVVSLLFMVINSIGSRGQ